MDVLFSELGTATVAGLAASSHCVAMCGPLAVAACAKPGGIAARPTLAYALGRTVSYALGGAVAGALGARAIHGLGADHVRQGAALTVAVAVLITAVRLWRRGGRVSPAVPLRLHRTAASARSLGLGLVNGLLPCGALASGLLIAAGTTSPVHGALAMVAFAAASAPGLVAAVVGGSLFVSLAASLVSWASVGTQRRVMSVGLLVLAGWLAVRPWTVRHGCHCGEHHAETMTHAAT